MTVSLVDTGTASPGAGVLTFAADLDGATALNALLWIIGGDKNSGTITQPADTPNLPIDLRTSAGDGHVSLAMAYGTADGGETTLSGSVSAKVAGGQVWVAELHDDVGTGPWARWGTSTHLTDGSAVTSLALGPVSVTETGLAVAAVAADSVNTQGTVTWTSSSGHTFTARRATASGGGQAGLWIATAPVAKGDTVSVDFARAGGSADQHSGLLTVLARTVLETDAVLAARAPQARGTMTGTARNRAQMSARAAQARGTLSGEVVGLVTATLAARAAQARGTLRAPIPWTRPMRGGAVVVGTGPTAGGVVLGTGPTASTVEVAE